MKTNQEYFVFERSEGDLAVLVADTGETKNLPPTELPSGVLLGDCLWWENETWQVDTEETSKRKHGNIALFRQLLESPNVTIKRDSLEKE